VKVGLRGDFAVSLWACCLAQPSAVPELYRSTLFSKLKFVSALTYFAGLVPGSTSESKVPEIAFVRLQW
jgi:hypothetical protein